MRKSCILSCRAALQGLVDAYERLFTSRHRLLWHAGICRSTKYSGSYMYHYCSAVTSWVELQALRR